MALGSLLSIGGRLLGGMLDGDGGVGDANAGNARLNQQINNLFREMGQRESLRFKTAEDRFKSLADNVMGDFDQASAGIGSTERSLTRGAVDRSKSNTANIKQGLASSGFSNSTIGANLQQGANSRLEQDLSNVSSQADRARSGLATTKAGFRTQVEGNLANLPLMRNSAEQNRLLNFTDALSKQGHVASGEKGGFGDLFGAFGGALGESGSMSSLFGGLGGLFG